MGVSLTGSGELGQGLPGPTARISGATAAIRFEDLPQDVVKAAKDVIADTIGVSIAGTQVESFRRIEALVRANGSVGKASVLRTGLRSSPEWVALANSVAAHTLDFDDWHGAGGVHPGAIVVPTALAVAEDRRATGRDLIASVVAGYETMIRVGILCGRNGFKLGFMPTATCGVFGAMAATASLYGLDAETIERGIGIATSMCSGVNCYMFAGGAWVKHLQVGWAAHSGVVAAKLAAAGYDAPKGALERRYGFCHTHGLEGCNTKELDSALRTYEIRNVQLKQYPCCSDLFTSIETVTSLVRENHISLGAIESIKIATTRFVAENCSQPFEMKVIPPSVSDARFSLPFIISLALTTGSVDLEQINDGALRDRSRIATARKVKARVDPELEAMFPKVSAAIVEVVTKSGSYKARMDHPSGSPENRMSRQKIFSKFEGCIEYGGLENAEVVGEVLANLERLRRVSDLTSMLTVSKPSARARQDSRRG